MKNLILAAVFGHVVDRPHGVSGAKTSARAGICPTAFCAKPTAASKVRVVGIAH